MFGHFSTLCYKALKSFLKNYRNQSFDLYHKGTSHLICDTNNFTVYKFSSERRFQTDYVLEYFYFDFNHDKKLACFAYHGNCNI